ncbi:Serine--tRNA ligase, mitochondrial [Thecaphora frezii]
MMAMARAGLFRWPPTRLPSLATLPLALRHASSTAAKKAASAPPPPPKQRRLQPPSPAGTLTPESIRDAITSLELRKMPVVQPDLDWLRQVKRRLAELTWEKNEHHKKLKHTTQRMSAIVVEIKGATAPSPKAIRKVARKASAANNSGDAAATKAAATDAQEASPAAAAAARSTAGSTERSPSNGEQPADATPSPAQRQNLEQELAFLRKESKRIKSEISSLEVEEDRIRERSLAIRLAWPNDLHPEVPVGSEDKAIVVSVKDPRGLLPAEFEVMKEPWNCSVLQLKDFAKGPAADSERDHLGLSAALQQGQIDMAAGVLSTGSSWPYLLGSISLLEHAISQYALAAAIRRGFLPVTPPDVVRAEMADRCGFRPRDEKAKQTYFLEPDRPSAGGNSAANASANDLCLAATAEIPLAALVAGHTFPNASMSGQPTNGGGLIDNHRLPIKLVALGHAFRAEAGARGADTRGLYRVHQFTKAEMFVVTESGADESNQALEELREIQEEVIGGLGLPYRVLDMPTEELGASAYRKYDIEAWMPGRGSWGEVSSASNCTDYQARRLGIRYQRSTSSSEATNGKDDASKRIEFAHTLNATAAAIPRLIVALLENYGVKDQKLVLPDALKPYWLGGADDGRVEWVNSGSASHATGTAGRLPALQRAIQQVRETAARRGTDPASMVASFLVLHELTAIVPLVVLFYLLSALGAGEAVLQWLQGGEEATGEARDEADWMGGYVRGWIQEGMSRAERYGRKNGYFGFDKEAASDDAEARGETSAGLPSGELAGAFANAVAAYALVKALLPLRLGASIALAGPFSRLCFEPLKRISRRMLARSTAASAK